MSIFLSAHGCKLKKKIDNLGSTTTLYFKAEDGSPCVNYLKYPFDKNIKNYEFEVKQKYPKELVNDYAIIFYWDYMENMDIYLYNTNNVGIFYPNEKNQYINLLNFGKLYRSKGEVFLLSDIIKYFNNIGYYSFYLSICRGDCDRELNRRNFKFTDFKKYLELPYVPTEYEISEQHHADFKIDYDKMKYDDVNYSETFSNESHLKPNNKTDETDQYIADYMAGSDNDDMDDDDMDVDPSISDYDPNRPLFTNEVLSSDHYIFNGHHPNSGGKYSKKRKKKKNKKENNQEKK